jgi:hypothetical protein
LFGVEQAVAVSQDEFVLAALVEDSVRFLDRHL